nr:13492_t:CDS:10 [Entrophospora candida]
MSTKNLYLTDFNIWDVDFNEHKLSLEQIFAEKNRKQISEFFYDEIFTGSDNKALFDRGVKDTIKATMEGYNGNKNQPGVIKQAVDTVFSYIRNAKFLLRVSYMEIYNEKINDLLIPVNKDLKIHEDRLVKVVVTKPSEVMKEISRGELNRHTGSTNWNERSSRSHTLFKMVIESSSKDAMPRRFSSSSSASSSAKTSGSVSVSNLIDLAGSEKAASDIERRKEGAFINKSLLTLGSVISKLTDSSGGHIPFRDSKLTRILQSSLVGNARISVICTISPSSLNLEESVNTLKFASRVKEVVTKAQTNTLIDDKALIKKYRMEIEELKAQLEKTGTYKEEEISVMLQQERSKYEEKFMEMELVRTALKKRIDDLTSLILNSNSFAPSSSRKPSSDAVVVPAIDSRIHEFEMLIDDKNLKIDSLTSNISEKTETIKDLQRQLEALKNTNRPDLNLTLAELNEKLKEKDDKLVSYCNSTEELEIIVKEDKKLIKEKNSKIQELSNIIEDDKILIGEKNEKIQELSNIIEDDKILINEKNEKIQELSNIIEDDKILINEKNEKIQELSNIIEDDKILVGEKNEKIQELSNIIEDDKILINEKNEKIQELSNIIEDDKILINEKNEKIQELSNIIEDDKILVGEKNEKIQELSSIIEDDKILINEKNEKIQELSSEVIKKDDAVEERNTEIKELSSELTIKDGSISEKNVKIQELALEISKLGKIVDDDKRLFQALLLDISKNNKTINELKNHYCVNTKTIRGLKEQLSKKDQEIILYKQKHDFEEELEVQRVIKQRSGNIVFTQLALHHIDKNVSIDPISSVPKDFEL